MRHPYPNEWDDSLRYEMSEALETILTTRIVVNEVRLSRFATQNAVQQSRRAFAETIAVLIYVKNSIKLARGSLNKVDA
jgi:hypothetical protein